MITQIENNLCSVEGLAAEFNWTCYDRDLYKLITLSWKIEGVKPMLSSTFYEPDSDKSASY